METKWNGIMKVLEVQHLDTDGKLLWEEKNLRNLLHGEGEAFILEILFVGGSIPTNYHLGLDNRTEITRDDTLVVTQATEPTFSGFGYDRNIVPSSNSFTLAESGGVFQATSPIIAFSASGGDWGPVSNLFLTDRADNNGALISSVKLSNTVTVVDGQTINVRIAMTLRDCPF